MTNKQYRIKTMTRAELDIAIEWAAQEGWNPGLHDADCYYQADPTGFLIGYLGEEPIATISVVRYAASFGFLGFYIVKPEYRGQGYGLKLWQAGLQYLKGCTIGLDGVVAQQENYKKSGFTLAYRNIRYEGVSAGHPGTVAGIVPLSELSSVEVEAYQRPFFPVDRSGFMQAWISQPDCCALGIVQNGQLVGCGVIRPCRTGYKIGPLFADAPEQAESLFVALSASVPSGMPIYLDIPECNLAAEALAVRHDMQRSFETARMYRQTAPQMPLERTFGVTSFEIG